MLARPLAEETGLGCACLGPCGGHNAAMAPAGLSRRGLLRNALAGVAAGAAFELPIVRPARAQSTLSPRQALQSLMDGNKRFVERRLVSYNEDLAMLQQNTAEKQEPFASRSILAPFEMSASFSTEHVDLMPAPIAICSRSTPRQVWLFW